MVAHLLSLMGALTASARIRLCRGEGTAVFALAQRMIDLAQEYGFVLYEAMGMMFQGSVWVQDGELDRGLALLTAGLARYRRLGSAASVPFFLTVLAQAHLQRGQVEEGLAVIEEAVQLTETHFVRFWTAEVHRLRGELLLAQAGQACRSSRYGDRARRGVLPAGPRHRTAAGGKSAGAAGGHQPQPPVAGAGQI